ncbi:TIM barrel protein [Candidatus Woesearchaeota archaeon]|nr:TIM barrel protein [Candidatus Woesearchaeota archaeon]
MKKSSKLLFGTAGIPAIAKGTGAVDGIKAVKELKLDAMELEFVHSVNVSEEKAPEIKKAAAESNVALTCHGQYYINLNAADSGKYEASKLRVLKAAHIANLCGATSVTFHPGFYMKSAKEEAYEKVKAALKEIVDKLRQQGNTIRVRPETTGKHSQFGTLKEVLQLSQELEQVLPCVDYAHMRAREGKNDYGSFREILAETEKILGKEALQNMHIQFAGVKFSEKGELNHLNLKDSDLNYEDMIKTWKEFKISGVAISESPNIEGDAMMLKRIYDG